MKNALRALAFLAATLQILSASVVAAPTPAEALDCYAYALEYSGNSIDRQGVVFQTLDGTTLLSHNSYRSFNPASVVKLATSAAALERLGYDYRFPTTVYTNGGLDRATGELRGDLVVVGSADPMLSTESMFLIADGLRQRGIGHVTGGLIVTGPFYANFSTNALDAGKTLRRVLDSTKWNKSIERAWSRLLQREGRRTFRSVAIEGDASWAPNISTADMTPIVTHRSMPLPKILKQLNNFSNNWMAHAIGDRLGGPRGIEAQITETFKLAPAAFRLQTASGLGSNGMTPADIAAMLRSFAPRLKNHGLSPCSIMPVAGIDPGTLSDRDLLPNSRNSIVAKTGTLRGVSTLAGFMYTRRYGTVVFVIMNAGGNPAAFRKTQDLLLTEMLDASGGAAPIAYSRPIRFAEITGAFIEPSRERIPEAPPIEPVEATEK